MANINIKQCLEVLSDILQSRKLFFTIYICGGAEIVLLGNNLRRTGDIDAISPEIDRELLKCALLTQKKLKLSDFWINNQVAPLSKRLPKGWKSKSIILYKSENLAVKGISREDLIATKLAALVNRQNSRDEDDLKWLNPTKTEKKYALEYLKRTQTDEMAIEVAKSYLEDL